MLLFKSKYIKNLDFLVSELKNYLSNNYKDAAHEYREKLSEYAKQCYSDGKITERQYRHYIGIYKHYTELMKDYYHYRSES